MKTFRQYAAERDLVEVQGVSDAIAKVGNSAAKKNPKVLPGLTPVPLVKQILTGDPGVEKLVQKDPTSAGAVGAYLGGPDAAKAIGAK